MTSSAFRLLGLGTPVPVVAWVSLQLKQVGNEVGPCVTLWQPAHGGHVGFPKGPVPGHVRSMPDAVGGWLLSQ